MSIRKSDRIISVEHVSKYFGEKAVLNDVNLQVRKGEFVTILGPSGCGKTTLLRLIAGFQTASEGVITMSGKEITQTPPHKRPVNTVFQKYALFPHLKRHLSWNRIQIIEKRLISPPMFFNSFSSRQ